MTGLSGRDFAQPGAPISAGYAHAKSAVRSHCLPVRLCCSQAILPENTNVNALVLEPGGTIAPAFRDVGGLDS